jgi:hypothetical protein
MSLALRRNNGSLFNDIGKVRIAIADWRVAFRVPAHGEEVQG